MRSWVIGIGAIGGLTAYHLARAGYDPIAIARSSSQIEVLRRHGLRVSGRFDDSTASVDVTSIDEIDALEDPEFVFLCVKCTATAEVVARIRHRLGPRSAVLALQNGMPIETLANAVGADCVIGTVAMISAERVEPGVVRSPRAGYLVVGELDGSHTGRVERAARMLSAVAPTTVSSDIWAESWGKLIRHVMIAPVCALTGLAADVAIQDPMLREVAVRLGVEAARTAKACGISLRSSRVYGQDGVPAADPQDPVVIERALVDQFSNTRGVRPSMLQDLEAGRATEIDFSNGWVVTKGDAVGVHASANAVVTDLVHCAEAQRPRHVLSSAELFDAVTRA